MRILPAFAALALLAAAAAHADPRLDEKVYDPYVEKGVAEFEARTAGQVGGPQGGAQTTVFEAEYGVSDRVSLAFVTTLENAPHERPAVTSLGVEAKAYLGRIPAVGLDVGGYLEFSQGLNGEPDVLESKLLLAKTAGRFQGLFNLIMERPFGGAGENFASYGYAASATWRAWGPLRLGAEAFGDLGDDHDFPGPGAAYVGPAARWEGRPGRAPFEIGVNAGWLFPVGADRTEAHSQFRLGVEIERRF